jgi:two-component system, NarL family, response regulator LiaR
MSDPHKIKVLLADDHDILRLSLKIYLETNDDLEVIGEAADGQQAIRLCEELRPDVVVMDVRMPVMDGLTATAIITQHPEIRVVILTSSLPHEWEQVAYQAGAQAILQKTTPSNQIPETIRLAVR